MQRAPAAAFLQPRMQTLLEPNGNLIDMAVGLVRIGPWWSNYAGVRVSGRAC